MIQYNNKVLLVEDSQEIYNQVKTGLADSMDIHWSDTIAKAEQILEQLDPGLILLDVDLPDGNGIDFCQKLQTTDTTAHIPVFFLSATTDVAQKVLGFSVGGDDYITKPFSTVELKARVESKIKKHSIHQSNQYKLEWDTIKINASKQSVMILGENKSEFEAVDLTLLEFKILFLLAERAGDVVDRGFILDEVWGKNVHVYPRSVDTHVSKLRKKIEKNKRFIHSSHGIGYQFIPNDQLKNLNV